jgi:hypothetical protein
MITLFSNLNLEQPCEQYYRLLSIKVFPDVWEPMAFRYRRGKSWSGSLQGRVELGSESR